MFSDECEYDESDPEGFRSGFVHITKALGGETLNVKVMEVPPGEAVCPYHYRCDSDVYAHGSGHGLGIGRHGFRRQSA